MKSYFLPINSKCLAHYFGCACVKPAQYFDNKPTDIQDKYKEHLLLTTNLGTYEEDCCIEILLYPEEENELIHISNVWFLYNSFLPISRVKNIYFSSEEQKQRTITNIQESTAFIPERMLCNKETFSGEGISQLNVPAENCSIDLNEQIRQYNRFLGALAVMRVARENYMNVSENYVDTLSYFNKEIEKQVKKVKKINQKFIGLFKVDKHFEPLLPYLNKDINENDLEKVASEEEQVIRKDPITRRIDLLRLDRRTYVIAFLYSFGVGIEGRKKNIDDAIIHNFNINDVKPDKAEVLALCYGYNRGYSAFNNFYRLTPSEQIDVKFRLEDKLDLYAIESVYKYITKKTYIENGNIEYINNLITHDRIRSHSRNEYIILETLIVGKKKEKVLSQEWWTSFFQDYQGGIYEHFKKVFEFLQISGNIRCEIERIARRVYDDTKEEVEEKYTTQIRGLKCQLKEKEENNKELNDKIVELELECKNNSLTSTVNKVQKSSEANNDKEINIGVEQEENPPKMVMKESSASPRQPQEPTNQEVKLKGNNKKNNAEDNGKKRENKPNKNEEGVQEIPKNEIKTSTKTETELSFPYND